MEFSDFIRQHSGEIIDGFEEFARTMMPPGVNMVPSQLRDHAQEMLTALVADMETRQSRGEQADKAEGLGSARAMEASGHLHADARIRHGFTPAQLLAEFRALRASVLLRYEQSGDTDPTGVRRFNEAIDEALTESMTRYAAMTDLYRDQFVGILGHDLRSPLNAIAAGATLLTMRPDGGHHTAHVATGILRSVHRMTRLIDDLLDLTMVRLGGALPVTRAPVDLEPLCQEVVFEARTAHGDAVVEFTSDGDLCGEWDRDRLAQVLSNLVGNAIQHGDGRVGFKAHGGAGKVVLTIHNDGRLIPLELQHAIFEPLVRHTSDVKDGNNLGLGLFIARAIVVAHEGDISVTSTDDHGTTFTVHLPRMATAS